jgi:transposase
MRTGSSGKITFKEYNQNQPMLLPPSYEEEVPSDHISRIVNKLIDDLDEEIFYEGYKGGGTSPYHPKMLAKIVIYSYVSKVYSGRIMEALLYDSITYRWLSGNNKPDFRTIN